MARRFGQHDFTGTVGLEQLLAQPCRQIGGLQIAGNVDQRAVEHRALIHQHPSETPDCPLVRLDRCRSRQPIGQGTTMRDEPQLWHDFARAVQQLLDQCRQRHRPLQRGFWTERLPATQQQQVIATGRDGLRLGIHLSHRHLLPLLLEPLSQRVGQRRGGFVDQQQPALGFGRWLDRQALDLLRSPGQQQMAASVQPCGQGRFVQKFDRLELRFGQQLPPHLRRLQ